MPEAPEVAALVAFLDREAVGRPVTALRVVAPAVLKTVAPTPDDLLGRSVAVVRRHGKFLALGVGPAGAGSEAGPEPDRWLVLHLARAGWLRWRDPVPDAPPRPGRGPLALRVALAGPGFDVTEAGTRKRLAAYVVAAPRDVPGIAALGPDALDPRLGPELLGVLAHGARVRLKRWLTDQSVLAGIGNAYSDEILHVARLSPFRTADTLGPPELAALADAIRTVLQDAVDRSVGEDAARLKAEKRSGMRVHARAGLPCPVCGDEVREVSYADSSFQYCPTCQTGGRVLSDRRMSRLLK